MAEEFKKQYRGCSRLYFAKRTADTEAGVMAWEKPKLLAPCKTVSNTKEQASEGVWADNHKKYNSRGGVEDVRTFDIFPPTLEVLAELFDDTLLDVADTVAYGDNPDAEFPEVAIGYALHDGDEDKPCELVWAFIATAQKRPDVTANTIQSGDTASEGQQIAFDIFKPDKAWEATGKKNTSICVRVTDAIDVEKWFAQVVTYDNVNTLFPKST